MSDYYCICQNLNFLLWLHSGGGWCKNCERTEETLKLYESPGVTDMILSSNQQNG